MAIYAASANDGIKRKILVSASNRTTAGGHPEGAFYKLDWGMPVEEHK